MMEGHASSCPKFTDATARVAPHKWSQPAEPHIHWHRPGITDPGYKKAAGFARNPAALN
jgi:hypothetical protein